jgi:HEAT repeat protein
MSNGASSADQTAAHQSNGSMKGLLHDLESQDPIIRQEARQRLTSAGKAAVDGLIGALQHPKRHVRWEAAKALAEIAAPSARLAMVGALEDEDVGVRWLAAEGLVAIEQAALVPLLLAIIDRPDSLWLREGAHHVLHKMTKGPLAGIVKPVLAALEHAVPEVEAPVAAYTALNALQETRQ